MHQEVLPGKERRRRWADSEKLSIVMEASDGVLSEVARHHDVTRQHIYQWRRELRSRGLLVDRQAVFVPVTVDDEASYPNSDPFTSKGGDRGLALEVGLRGGRCVRLALDVPDAVLQRLIRLVEAA